MSHSVVISGDGKGVLQSMPFDAMKNAVLGESYLLSVAIVSEDASQRLNRTYRGIDTPTDILSFPLGEGEGEIVFNLEEAREEAKKFGREFDNFLAFLFIHGLVHLKGLDHGKKMEREELRIRSLFKI